MSAFTLCPSPSDDSGHRLVTPDGADEEAEESDRALAGVDRARHHDRHEQPRG